MMNIEILNADAIKVVRVDGKVFDGKRFKGWAMHIEGIGYMAHEGKRIPYMLDTKKYMTAIKNGWGFDWDYTIIQDEK